MSKNYVSSWIYIDSLEGKKLFLDFWKLPYSKNNDFEPSVSVVSQAELDTEHSNAMVLIRGDSEPQLCHLNNGIHLYAKFRKLKTYPSNLDVVTPILDKEENIISYILKDSERNIIYLPFCIDEVIEGFCYEKYLTGKRKTFLPKSLLSLYYSTKHLTPPVVQTYARTKLAKIQRNRKFPRWPLELSLEDFRRFILELLISISKTGELPFLWFWPLNKESCLLLTHDIESKLEGNGGIHRIISREQSLGFRSSFNVVPFKYKINEKALNKIRSSGCEIGVHGHSHDAKLFSSFKIFQKKIQEVNKIAKNWNAVGFRSASTYRNPDWYPLMEFDYDSSFFDSDPFEPQPGGCLSFFPYFIGDIVEIPTTMAQDYTLFVLLKENDIRFWREKAAEIIKKNGLICLIAHPDEGYIGDKDKEKHYVEFLEYLNRDNTIWNPWPKEVAAWWRRRHGSQIIANGEDVRIRNGTSEMCVRWARLVNNELKFDIR